MSVTSRRDVDMTQGSITGHLIRFAMPLLLGNLFQQLYNLVDTYVVGNYVSNEAYAAVGSVTPVINSFLGLFIGFSAGAGVVISQYYGAHRTEDVRRAVHTTVLFCLLLCLPFTGLALALMPTMLRINNTPPNVWDQSLTYLNIYFSGVTATLVYNIGSGILRAVGDSRRPFYYLVVCALMNVALDLLFVLRFGMGVAGVALATVLSQAVSALLVVITLLRTSACVRVEPRQLRIHRDMLRQIIRVGAPSGFQHALTAFSNVFVCSYINHFGDLFMSAWGTYSKVDQILFLPQQSISTSVTTFVGQNLGAGQLQRAKRGIRLGLVYSLAITGLGMIPVLLFAAPIAAVFNKTPQVVEYATLLLRVITPFYLINCFNHIYSGALRGAGNSRVPMIIMLSTFVGFRQVYLFCMSRICNEVLPIAMSFPAGWILCTAITVIYYHRTRLENTRLTKA